MGIIVERGTEALLVTVSMVEFCAKVGAAEVAGAAMELTLGTGGAVRKTPPGLGACELAVSREEAEWLLDTYMLEATEVVTGLTVVVATGGAELIGAEEAIDGAEPAGAEEATGGLPEPEPEPAPAPAFPQLPVGGEVP